MKTLTVFLATVLLLSLTACGGGFDAAAEEEALMAVSDEINTAMAKVDVEEIMRLFHTDFTSFETWPDTGYVVSREDLNSGWLSTTMRWDDYEVIVSSDTAVIKGYMSWQSVGDPIRHVYQTSVFKKEEGQWRLWHSHTSYRP